MDSSLWSQNVRRHKKPGRREQAKLGRAERRIGKLGVG
jgi:hypothetical protein